MKRWLPSLPLSAALWAFWLLLNDSVAPADLLLGGLLALLAPVLTLPLKPPGPRLHRPVVLAHLVLRVGGDVVQRVRHHHDVGLLVGQRQRLRGAVEVVAGVTRIGAPGERHHRVAALDADDVGTLRPEPPHQLTGAAPDVDDPPTVERYVAWQVRVQGVGRQSGHGVDSRASRAAMRRLPRARSRGTVRGDGGST